MELRAARTAARRRVGSSTAAVTVAGFAWLVLALPAAASAAGRDPAEPPLLDAAAVARDALAAARGAGGRP